MAAAGAFHDLENNWWGSEEVLPAAIVLSETVGRAVLCGGCLQRWFGGSIDVAVQTGESVASSSEEAGVGAAGDDGGAGGDGTERGENSDAEDGEPTLYDLRRGLRGSLGKG